MPSKRSALIAGVALAAMVGAVSVSVASAAPTVTGASRYCTLVTNADGSTDDHCVPVVGPTPTPTVAPTTVSPTTVPPTTAPPTATPTPTQTATTGPAAWPSAANTGPTVACSSLTRMGDVTLSKAGQVLQNADVHGTITVTAAGVKILNSCVRPDAKREFGVVINWVDGTVIDHVEIDGNGLVSQGVESYDDTITTVRFSEISGTDDGIAACIGTYTDNFIHAPANTSDAHTDMLQCTGWRTSWDQKRTLLVQHNTIDNPRTQTGAVSIFQDNGVAARNSTVTGNLLSGGSITVYAGGGPAGAGSNLVFTNNVFARCGTSGCVTAFDRSGPGNVWSGNVMSSGAAVNP